MVKEKRNENGYRISARESAFRRNYSRERRRLLPILEREHIRFSGTPEEHKDMPYVSEDAKTIEDVLTTLGYDRNRVDVIDGTWQIDCFILYTRRNGDDLDVLSDRDLRTGNFRPTLYAFEPNNYSGWVRDLGYKENTFYANEEPKCGREKSFVASIPLVLSGVVIGGPLGVLVVLASLGAGTWGVLAGRSARRIPQDSLKKKVVVKGNEALLRTLHRAFDSEIFK